MRLSTLIYVYVLYLNYKYTEREMNYWRFSHDLTPPMRTQMLEHTRLILFNVRIGATHGNFLDGAVLSEGMPRSNRFQHSKTKPGLVLSKRILWTW